MKWTPPKSKSKRWQLQEAKAKFSEVFERALTEGPQYVTRRNKDEVVVARRSDFERGASKKKQPSLVEALMACPVEFHIPDRDRSDRVPTNKPPLFE